MMDDVLTDQVGYYRSRAGEYDATAYGDVADARERIARLVGRMQPGGRVLEFACGTGLWTEAIAGLADTVLAVDAAPEAVAIARDRVPTGNVTFEVADVFGWTAEHRYDVIFFSAWLSHVPADRFAEFWRMLRGLLAEGGRVLFIDEHVDERAKEAYVPGADEIVERRLADGRTFRIVKNFVDPEALRIRLRDLGWDCWIDRDGNDWIRGEARPSVGPRPNRSVPAATVVPVLTYTDVRAAVAWLSAAFGFVERVRIGENHRAQLAFGAGAVIVADAGGDRRPPQPGEVTHSVLVRVDDVRAHCERSRAHDARIVMEPTDYEYGERQYRAEDPAGHQWTFSETLADVAPSDWGGEAVSVVPSVPTAVRGSWAVS